MEKRELASSSGGERETFKCISASELASYLDSGWAYVEVFKADEVNACNKNGRKVPATIRDSRCSSCGDRVDLIKFSDHFCSVQPTMAVVKRKATGPVLDGALLGTVSDHIVLNFDASFG
jgi:hypothetical protein